MLKALEVYYASNGILSEDFRCKHRDACSRGYEKHFTEAKAAFVGTRYEEGRIPRLLFASLDSGEGDPDPSKRTPLGVREENENPELAEVRRYPHWRETRNLAVTLLKDFDSDITFENSPRFFCHVNSAKCSVNRPGSKQAPPILFDNCEEYLSGELSVLKPDIIVSQGRAAESVVHRALAPNDPDDRIGLLRIARLEGRSILWIATYHPRARKRFWDEKANRWPKYKNSVIDFVRGKST